MCACKNDKSSTIQFSVEMYGLQSLFSVNSLIMFDSDLSVYVCVEDEVRN